MSLDLAADATSRVDTTADLLRAGWDIILEELGWDRDHPYDEDPERTEAKRKDKGPRLLAAVNAGDVAERLGVTTGAFYRRWPDRRSFVSDLAEYILDRRRQVDSGAEKVSREFDESVWRRDGLTAVIRKVAAAQLELIGNSPGFAVQMNLWSVGRRYPSIRRLLAKYYRDSADHWVPKYKTLVSASGWQFRPGVDALSLSVVMTALAEGFAVRRAVEPEAATPELFAEAAMAIALAFFDWTGDGEGVEARLRQAVDTARGTP